VGLLHSLQAILSLTYNLELLPQVKEGPQPLPYRYIVIDN
jgi:hypothetical protein